MHEKPATTPSPPAEEVFRSMYPFEESRIRAAAIYCSDGRYGEQFDEFLHTALLLPRYDRVAIPGGPGCLAGHFAAYKEEEVLVEQLDFLIRSHELNRMVLIQHESCGFYLKKLSMRADQVLGQLSKDLGKAATRLWSIRRSLEIDAYLAVRHGEFVKFVPVDLKVEAAAW
jgi:hypothetical protein